MDKTVLKNRKQNNKALPFVTAWVTLEGLMLSQAEEDNNCRVSLRCGIKKQQTKTDSWRQRPKEWLSEKRSWRMREKRKGNMINNAMISLHSDRGLLELVVG